MRGSVGEILGTTQSGSCNPNSFLISSYLSLAQSNLTLLAPIHSLPESLLCSSNSLFQKYFQEYDSEMSPLNQSSDSCCRGTRLTSLHPRNAALLHKNLSHLPWASSVPFYSPFTYTNLLCYNAHIFFLLVLLSSKSQSTVYVLGVQHNDLT